MAEKILISWIGGQDLQAIKNNNSVNGGKIFLTQLSKDLMAEFPDIKGFSKRHLELIRQCHLYWS